MEFKGTKGKWKVLKYDSDLEVGNNKEQLICSLPDKGEEYYSNALLISKAPEMLEMLININEYLLSMSCVKSHSYQVEVEQLIKEATEL